MENTTGEKSGADQDMTNNKSLEDAEAKLIDEKYGIP